MDFQLVFINGYAVQDQLLTKTLKKQIKLINQLWFYLRRFPSLITHSSLCLTCRTSVDRKRKKCWQIACQDVEIRKLEIQFPLFKWIRKKHIFHVFLMSQVLELTGSRKFECLLERETKIEFSNFTQYFNNMLKAPMFILFDFSLGY